MSMRKFFFFLLIFSCVFSFRLPEGKYELNEQGINYCLYVPPKLTGKMILVLHDIAQSPSNFVDFWYETAKENNYLVLAPSAQNNNWIQDEEEQVFRILNNIKKDYAVEKVLINGFSESSHFALYLLSNNTYEFSGLCNFSGLVVNSLNLEKFLLLDNMPPFLFIHGMLDEELPVKISRWDVQQFRQKGFDIVYWEVEKKEKIKQDVIDWFEEITSQ